jgi:hypothetical protein
MTAQRLDHLLGGAVGGLRRHLSPEGAVA